MFDALLLLSFGGPEGPEQVRPFLENVTRGRNVPPERLDDVAQHDADALIQIDMSEYNGTAGSMIIVNAKDDFRVARVKVSIHSSTGVLVEEGDAILDPIKRSLWNYTVTQNNPVLSGSVISAIATDLPGNNASLAVTK